MLRNIETIVLLAKKKQNASLAFRLEIQSCLERKNLNSGYHIYYITYGSNGRFMIIIKNILHARKVTTVYLQDG